MTEAKIEAILAAKIAELNLAGVKVFTTFGPGVYDEENADAAVVTINTTNRQQEGWEIPQYDITLGVELVSRLEFGKSAHIARVEALTTLLDGWTCRTGSAQMDEDFTIANEFTPCYVTIGGGDNSVDLDDGTFSWRQEITLRGIIK